MQPVSPSTGESGYFSTPSTRLDPRLFSGDSVRTEVRNWVLNTLYSFWSSRYRNPRDWSTVWIAGSGISYQWEAARGNGDLDILIGVDFDGFLDDNPKFAGMPEADLAEIFNQEFHTYLWPTTAHTEINETGAPNEIGQENIFEVTFYVNPGATDIRDINPYAAYNLTANAWTVRPPEGDSFTHPKAYYDQAESEAEQARGLLGQYNTLAAQAKAMNPGSPGWHNAMRQVELVVGQASSLYDSIHLGRKQAFSKGGSGYGDYYNFRWQYHKQHGTAQALHAVGAAHSAAQSEYATAMYGGAIDGADVALRRAVLWNRGGNGR
jgi:hypothetical protein